MERSSLLAVVCLVALVFATVQATSNADPRYIYFCDVFNPLIGCDPSQWISGDRLNCRNKTTNIMSWATRPTRSSCFQLYAGDPNLPLSTYVPDEYLYIYIVSTCYRVAFRGLMLYAEPVRNTSLRVGEWILPAADLPSPFSLPWDANNNSLCRHVLMHNGAIEKSYHSIVRFKAPPAGTGPITFRALLKVS